MNIKNQHVYDLARKLSQRTGRSMTSVIEAALEMQLAAMDAELDVRRARKMAELDQIVARTAPVLRRAKVDVFADLYDQDTGLPR